MQSQGYNLADHNNRDIETPGTPLDVHKSLGIVDKDIEQNDRKSTQRIVGSTQQNSLEAHNANSSSFKDVTNQDIAHATEPEKAEVVSSIPPETAGDYKLSARNPKVDSAPGGEEDS